MSKTKTRDRSMSTAPELETHLRSLLRTDAAAANKIAREASTGKALTLAQEIDIADLSARTADLDAQIRAIPRVNVSQVREADIYERGGPHSYFRDMLAVRGIVPIAGDDPVSARDRLSRHSVVRKDQIRASQQKAQRRVSETGIEARDLGANTSGLGSEFVPPRWIDQLFASVARGPSPLASIFRSVPLPDGTLSLNVPVFDFAPGPVPQVQNTNTAVDIDAPTSLITMPVRTISGDVILSRQLLERSDLDEYIVIDTSEAYGQELEYQLVNGTNSNSIGDLLGLINVANTTSFTASVTTPTLYVQALGQTAAAVAAARLRVPSFILCRDRRHLWMSAAVDTASGEQLVKPGTGMIAKNDVGPFGPYGSLPLWIDAAIPVASSNVPGSENYSATGGSDDFAIVGRGQDLILLQGPPIYSTLDDASGLAGSLSAAITMHCYVCTIPNRYPSGIGIFSGSTFPSGW